MSNKRAASFHPLTDPEVIARLEGRASNPALANETVRKAEQRAREGWPWPVSGDDTKRGAPYPVGRGG